MPKELIQKFLVLPVEKAAGRMKVIVHDRMDLELMDTIRFRMNCEVETVLASRAKIKNYIDTVFSESQASIDDTLQDLASSPNAAALTSAPTRSRSPTTAPATHPSFASCTR